MVKLDLPFDTQPVADVQIHGPYVTTEKRCWTVHTFDGFEAVYYRYHDEDRALAARAALEQGRTPAWP